MCILTFASLSLFCVCSWTIRCSRFGNIQYVIIPIFSSILDLFVLFAIISFYTTGYGFRIALIDSTNYISLKIPDQWYAWYYDVRNILEKIDILDLISYDAAVRGVALGQRPDPAYSVARELWRLDRVNNSMLLVLSSRTSRKRQAWAVALI